MVDKGPSGKSSDLGDLKGNDLVKFVVKGRTRKWKKILAELESLKSFLQN